MSEKEKEAIEQLRSWRKYIIEHRESVNKANDIEFYLRTALNLIEKQQKELDNLKEIEQSHQEENGKLRVELEQEKEKNTELRIQISAREQVCEDLQKQLNGAFDRGFISKDKIKEKMEQTKKVYDEEMKPYMIEVGNGEKVLNVTYLSKKEKEELINKRNCLLVQIKTYEMLLEDK